MAAAALLGAAATGGDATFSAAALQGAPVGTRVVLPNGLVVLVAERPALPIVSVRVAVEAGAVLDPPDRPGLAHLTARLLTRGTARRSAAELDRAIEFVGGSLEADGERDGATLALDVLRRDLDLGLDLLAEVLRHPAFPEDEVDRMRERVRASIQESEQDPETVAARVLRRLAFPGHPYGRPVAGTEESVGRITREEVVAFYRAHYRPDRTVVAVAGAVAAPEVEAALLRRFGDWRAEGPVPLPPPPAPTGVPRALETVGRDVTQATVYLGQATVGRAHPDFYALQVASQVLGGGSASRLYGRVREERGLAYSVFSDYAVGRYGGFFVVGFQSENARARETLALVRQELERLRQEPVGADELGRAKSYLIGSFPLRTTTNAEVASLLLTVERFGLGLDHPVRRRRALEAVTAEDVARAVRAHWDPTRMSLAVVANLAITGPWEP